MSILIKNMEMPENCMLCPLCVEEADPTNGEMCMVTGKLMPPCNRERLADCPLVPVPPHGDLVDLKAPFKAQYYDEMTEEWLEKTVTVEDALYGCMVDEMPPTIIPAEEEQI